MNKKISILGSTGSIGTQSLEVIEKLGLGVAAITGNRNVELLEYQARKFKPDLVAVYDKASADKLKTLMADTDIKVYSGIEGLEAAAAHRDADTVITAVVGTIGLKPTLEAIHCGKRIALANKETLVCAGEIVMDEAKRYNAEILPVDSEHSAIFQCLGGNITKQLKRIFLTASGGPFRGKRRHELVGIKKEDALKHPNWDMGSKITIDSATMMNKGLEFIEAMHLFNVNPDQIEVLVHPQSIIHSMVEFADNSVIAQLGVPDMKIPIQLALTWPERTRSSSPELSLCEIGSLTFEKPDVDAFPCLKLAMDAAKKTGTAPAVMNAANEVAVELFLQDKIRFMDIFTVVTEAMNKMSFIKKPNLEQILELDSQTRLHVREYAERQIKCI